jgi:hypothetical protein
MRHSLPRILLGCLIFLLPIIALGQTVPVASTNYSGSITTTSTFQVIQGQTNNRQGCTIQDQGTHTMYVFFGPIANATLATSAQITAGQSINCAVNGNLVVKDAISITGTSGDAFFANFQ